MRKMAHENKSVARWRGWRVAGLSLLLGLAGAGKAVAADAAKTHSFSTLKKGELRVCLYGNFQPFVGKDGGTWSGWDYAYLLDFARSRQLEMVIVEQPKFGDIWLKPGEDKCDIAGSGISVLPERTEAIGTRGKWSAQYYFVQRSFAVGLGTKVTDLGDLATPPGEPDRKIYVTTGSTADLDLTNQIQCAKKTGAKFVIIRNDDEAGNIRKVKDGSAFAYGGGYGSICYSVQDHKAKAAWTHDYLDSNCQSAKEPFSFVVRVASKGLREELDDYIGDGSAYPGNRSPLKCD